MCGFMDKDIMRKQRHDHYISLSQESEDEKGGTQEAKDLGF